MKEKQFSIFILFCLLNYIFSFPSIDKYPLDINLIISFTSLSRLRKIADMENSESITWES